MTTSASTSASAPAPDGTPITFTSGPLSLTGDRWKAQSSYGTVLLLHGGGQTRHSWHRAGPRIAAAGWDTVSVDARGHGDSSWAPDGDYTLEAMEHDIWSIGDQLDAGPLVLVGASMGGTVSLLAAADRPGFARALVLVDIAPRIEPEGVERITSFMTARPEGFETLEEVAEAVHAYNPHRSRPPTTKGLRKNVRLRDGRWHWHWDPAFLKAGPEPRRELGFARVEAAARKVTVPTLLVRGKQSDIVSEQGAQELLELVPGSRFVDISGAGHMVAGDDNDVFSDAVLSFLTEISAR